jgi:hypothetical protein
MNRETVSKEMKLKFNNLFYFSIIKGKFERGPSIEFHFVKNTYKLLDYCSFPRKNKVVVA